MKLLGSTISLLEKGLNYSTTRGKVISQNIANGDTPNYRAKNVRFKDFLDEAKHTELLAYKTSPKHFDFKKKVGQVGVFNLANFQYFHNGNGVDMDKEQANLAENQIYYNALVDRLSERFNTIQSVIKGGR